jgi:hypothetical protein
MAEPQMVDPHDPVMTGENSFIRLSNDGGKTILDRVSHWRVLWSPAGQGHALFIESPLLGKEGRAARRLYADNAGVARFLQRMIEILLYKEFADGSLAVIDAKFERSGNSLSTVEERIVSRKDEIILTWWDPMPPFVLTMPPGAMNRPLGVYKHFHPGAQRPAFGKRRSSHGQGFPAGTLRQALIELLPGVVGDVDQAQGLIRILTSR